MQYGPRKIKDGSRFDKFFPKSPIDTIPAGNNGVEHNVNVVIPQVIKKYNYQAKDIADYLYNKDLKTFCKNIWQFCFDYIQYEFDKPGKEQLRTPQRTWADRTNGVDCDCFSIFISSILTQKNIPHHIRITKYDNNTNWQHIYVIVPKNDKFNPYEPSTYFVIDAVIHSFNTEKAFTDSKTFYMNGQLGTVTEILNGLDGNGRRMMRKHVLYGILDNEVTGLGAATETELNKIKTHLEQTRIWIVNNPTAYKNQGGDQATMLKMIDYALENWDKGAATRDKALAILAQNEARYNREVLKLNDTDLDGVIDFDDYSFDGLGNFGATKAQRVAKRAAKKEERKDKKEDRKERREDKKEIKADSKTERKVERKEEKQERKTERQEAQGFFRKIGVAAKQGGEAVFVKYNPAVIAGRQGLLLAIKLNLFRLASRLSPALSANPSAASKKMYDAVMKIYDDKLQGSSAELNEAIKIGALKQGQDLKGIALGVLGSDPVTLSALLSAVPILVSVVNAINNVEYEYGMEGWTMDDDIFETEIIAEELDNLAATGPKKVDVKMITDFIKTLFGKIQQNRELKQSMSKEDYAKHKKEKRAGKKEIRKEFNQKNGNFITRTINKITGKSAPEKSADIDADNEQILDEKVSVDPNANGTWWQRNKKWALPTGIGIGALAVITGAVKIFGGSNKTKAKAKPGLSGVSRTPKKVISVKL